MGLDSYGSLQEQVTRSCKHDNKFEGSTKFGEFLD